MPEKKSKKPSGVKVYPVKGHYLSGVPRVVQVVKTKKDAEEMVASGAFTDNPNDADRDHEVEDRSPAYLEADGSPAETDDIVTPPRTTTLGENPEDETQPASVPPSDGNDSEEG